ncbi:MAG TPA: hypothetical protein VF246_00700 [Acidimicrobiia bacterium]
MEPHHDDATTSGDPWRRANEEIGELGRRLRDLYRSVADDEGPTEDDIRDAFSTLAGAWNKVATTFGNALQDPGVRRHLRTAVGSLADAVGATVSGLAAEISREDAAGEEE